jgi:amidohydrolase
VELPDAVRHHAGGRPVQLTFGAIHAGDAPNVVPSQAVLQATVRSPDADLWPDLEQVVRTALAEAVEPDGAGWSLEYTAGHPPVVNEPRATATVARAAEVLLGDAGIRPTGQSVGGDDFSWYLDRVPGCYVRLGVRGPGAPSTPIDLHTADFDVDERCIAVGIKVLVGTALLAGRSA